jgi:hypothetical protein
MDSERNLHLTLQVFREHLMCRSVGPCPGSIRAASSVAISAGQQFRPKMYGDCITILH